MKLPWFVPCVDVTPVVTCLKLTHFTCVGFRRIQWQHQMSQIRRDNDYPQTECDKEKEGWGVPKDGVRKILETRRSKLMVHSDSSFYIHTPAAVARGIVCSQSEHTASSWQCALNSDLVALISACISNALRNWRQQSNQFCRGAGSRRNSSARPSAVCTTTHTYTRARSHARPFARLTCNGITDLSSVSYIYSTSLLFTH